MCCESRSLLATYCRPPLSVVLVTLDRWRAVRAPYQVPHHHHATDEEERRLSAPGPVTDRLEVAIPQQKPPVARGQGYLAGGEW